MTDALAIIKNGRAGSCCLECAKATYKGVSRQGFEFMIRMKRIHCTAYPNERDRHIYVYNPQLLEPVCSLFSPVNSAELQKRAESLLPYLQPTHKHGNQSKPSLCKNRTADARKDQESDLLL